MCLTILNDKGRHSVQQNAIVHHNSDRSLLRHRATLLQSPNVVNQWICKDLSCDALIADKPCLQIAHICFPWGKLKLHITQHKSNIYTSHITVAKKPALSEVQRYVFDSLLKHQLSRDNTFALIRSCGNEMYEVEKSKKKLENPGSYAVATFRWPRKSFYGPKIIYITIA